MRKLYDALYVAAPGLFVMVGMLVIAFAEAQAKGIIDIRNLF